MTLHNQFSGLAARALFDLEMFQSIHHKTEYHGDIEDYPTDCFLEVASQGKELTEHLSKLNQTDFVKNLKTAQHFTELLRTRLPQDVTDVIQKYFNSPSTFQGFEIISPLHQPNFLHVTKVYPEHEYSLNGWKWIFPTVGDGACLDNSATTHIHEDPAQAFHLERIRHPFIVNNWWYFLA